MRAGFSCEGPAAAAAVVGQRQQWFTLLRMFPSIIMFVAGFLGPSVVDCWSFRANKTCNLYMLGGRGEEGGEVNSRGEK